MRITTRIAANLIAWALLAALFGVAVVITDRLGFAGLLVLGLLVWLVCTRAAQSEAMPTWGALAFRAAMTPPRSPEERAAQQAERAVTLEPLRFFGRCGMGLVLLGMAGIAAQHWGLLPG